MSKTTEKTARRSAAMVALLASGRELGFTAENATTGAISAARKLAPSDFLNRDKDGQKPFLPLIQEFGDGFKVGYLASYLSNRGYARRWGNMEHAAIFDSAAEIMSKSEPTSDNSNRRTELEQSGVKASQNAWKYVKEQAGLKARPAARPKTGANLAPAAGTAKEIPSGHVTMPKFTAPIDAVEFFDRLSREVLTGVNANALATPIAIKSAVQDFRKAIRAAVATAKAGAQRSAKAKATRGTVSAADVAAKQQRVAGGNGQSAN